MAHDIDVHDFKRFEHDRWEQSVVAFDTYFGPLTRSLEPALLAALAPAAGQAALDVATGPGYLALALEKLGCRTTGLDISEAMIACAKSEHPESSIEFVVGDAEQLPFADAAFDLVCMNFGILHLAQPEVAAREAFRVLKPGGRFAFTIWSTPNEAKGFEIALGALEQHGCPTVKLPVGPPFFRYAHKVAGLGLLTEAGFVEPHAQLVPLAWKLPSPEALFAAFLEGTARTGGALRAQPGEHLEKIRSVIVAEATTYAVEDGVRIPMAAWVYSAAKP